ncbi:hypothetical protein CC2G_009980 [Coprinopsis cinerea AmutBmut pab1-1]|nr:hypothetical protein CC2G_009980 [Coprinopsis cinerea AmutBmut pab1-1]
MRPDSPSLGAIPLLLDELGKYCTLAKPSSVRTEREGGLSVPQAGKGQPVRREDLVEASVVQDADTPISLTEQE